MQNRLCKCLLSIFVTVTIIGASFDAHAQANTHWRKIWDAYVATGDTSIAWAGYFWSPTHGMVGIESNIGDTATTPRIFYTEDGINWIESIHPTPMYSHNAVQFTSIQMEDADTGWAGLQLFAQDTNAFDWMWKTTDGGKSWQGGQPLRAGLGQAENFEFDYFDSTFDIIGSGFGNNSMLGNYGTDRGWISDNVGINSGCWSTAIGTQNALTLDGGMTWGILPGAGVPEWGMYGSSRTKTFFTTSMWMRIRNGSVSPATGSHNPITNYPYTSQDSGKTWIQGKYPDALYGNPFITGDVEGGRNAIYVQTFPADSIGLVTNAPGLIRTTDNGGTWKYVGGPANDILSRFCVLPCIGSTVVAFDYEGGVWLTTDGGDGTLQDHPAEPIMSTGDLQLTALLCSDTTNGLRFTDDHCDVFTLLGVSFVDSSLVKLGVLSFDTIPIVPHDYGSDMSDTIGVRWNPGAAFTADTTAKAKIDLHYLSVTDGLEHDTIVTLTLIAKHGAIGSQLSTTALNFGSVSTCLLADSVLTIANIGCAATTVDSIIISGSGFSILSYDSSIATARSGKIVLRYTPGQSGQNNGELNIFLSQQGVHTKQVVDLFGQGVQGEGILYIASTILDAGSFSTCSADTVVGTTISNVGCDTLVISNIKISGDATFSIKSSPADSLLAPDSIRSFSFNFAPRVKGAHSARVTFNSRNLHGNDTGQDVTIHIDGTATGGAKILASDLSSANFGSLYICEDRDTTIVLSNLGCDTLALKGDSIFNSSYSTDTTYPIIIPPGATARVRLHLMADSLGMSGSITFFSDANNGDSNVTVQLQASLLRPASLKIVLDPSDSAFSGASVTGYIVLQGAVPSSEITSLSFDITHNDDLLTFVNAVGVGLTVSGTGTAQLHFTLSPVVGGASKLDTIGRLTFRVYLTDSLTTQLSVSNISFSPFFMGVQPDCIASIGDTGASFTYLSRCGDKTIQEAMNGVLPFSIESIQPNPASSNIEIKLRKSSSSPTDYALFDAIGRTIISNQMTTSQFMFDVSDVPAGYYYIRLSQNGYVQTRSVAIER